MKITFKEDLRTFKKGEVFDFNMIEKIKSILVVGDNGSGKTTLLQALRGKVSSKKKTHATELHDTDYKNLAKSIDIEHTYDDVLFFDIVTDNANHFMTAFDAVAYVEAGGFTTKSISHGQSHLYYLKKIGDAAKVAATKGKVLVVLDEIDSGFSLTNLAKFNNFLLYLTTIVKCHVLVVTHNPFVMMHNHIIFDLEKKDWAIASTYIAAKTGFELCVKSHEED